MDKAGSEQAGSRWSWLPSFMPGVAGMLAEKRALHGQAYVAECWKRGVVLREPGWFFAVEGSIAIGTPDDDARLAWFASLGPVWTGGKGSTRMQVETPDQVLLVMRNPQEVSHGAN